MASFERVQLSHSARRGEKLFSTPTPPVPTIEALCFPDIDYLKPLTFLPDAYTWVAHPRWANELSKTVLGR